MTMGGDHLVTGIF